MLLLKIIAHLHRFFFWKKNIAWYLFGKVQRDPPPQKKKALMKKKSPFFSSPSRAKFISHCLEPTFPCWQLRETQRVAFPEGKINPKGPSTKGGGKGKKKEGDWKREIYFFGKKRGGKWEKKVNSLHSSLSTSFLPNFNHPISVTRFVADQKKPSKKRYSFLVGTHIG